ncbi:hypothetical protein [Halobacillus sp. A5]|uniref:hypothetical protein n=1 Tax=Halobacillus sp. A5 TaxID=2880263 RepID=UPI0020A644BA|nr:hypothetical protein [Halobacillus sp. A5]MCP3028980.1 hypothetical protein [Halobacillus sp. A5]
MAYEETFGVFIDWREDIQQHFKILAEGIKFNDDPKLIAKPVNLTDNSHTLTWLILDENGNKRADVIFTVRPGQRHFSIQNGKRIEVDGMLYYSAKVRADQKIFLKETFPIIWST